METESIEMSLEASDKLGEGDGPKWGEGSRDPSKSSNQSVMQWVSDKGSRVASKL